MTATTVLEYSDVLPGVGRFVIGEPATDVWVAVAVISSSACTPLTGALNVAVPDASVVTTTCPMKYSPSRVPATESISGVRKNSIVNLVRGRLLSDPCTVVELPNVTAEVRVG